MCDIFTRTAMDLTTEEGVKLYLHSQGYRSCHTVERLPEGFCGFVYRAHQSDQPQTMVIKHVAEHAARSPSYKLDQNRLEYEHEALQVFSTLTSPGVGVPQIYSFDRENFVLVMEDAGGGKTISLKSWLKSDMGGGAQECLAEARRIGSALGSFLSEVHSLSEDIKSQFDGNTTARKLSSTVYFSRLTIEASKHGFNGEHFAKATEKGERDVFERNDVLTIGDFWTGNVLVYPGRKHGGPDLFIVDFELAKPGTAAFDVGQMLAEMECLSYFRNADAGSELFNSFLSTYCKQTSCSLTSSFFSDLAIRIGAHLFTIMPRAWSTEGTEAEIEALLKKADTYIQAGVEQDVDALKGLGLTEGRPIFIA